VYASKGGIGHIVQIALGEVRQAEALKGGGVKAFAQAGNAHAK
jgi:hypothetical protein